MTSEARKKNYLLKAEEAEKEAARTRHQETKASWLQIAKSYRDLAKTT